MADLANGPESSETEDMRIEQIIREAKVTHRSITLDQLDDFPDESSWADYEDEFIAEITNNHWH